VLRAILLTGTVAAGKTVVAAEVGWQLSEREVPVAVIDLDWLAWAYLGGRHESGRIDELIAANLAAMLPNYRAAGIAHYVLARALLKRATLEGVLAALPAVDLKVIRLDASPATLEARVRARDAGHEQVEHLRELPGFTRAVEEAGLEEATVSNEGRSVEQVAAEVLRVAGWEPE
jgi:hypothetical protein